MPAGQAVSPPVLGVIPREYVDEPYIAKNNGYPAVKTTSSYVNSF